MFKLERLRGLALGRLQVGNRIDEKKADLAVRGLAVKGTTNDDDLAEYGVQVAATDTIQGRGAVATKHFSPNQYIFVS
jgi:hypothetical protein